LSLTATFVTLPLQLQALHLAAPQHWKIYLPALLISFLLMIPMLIMASKKQRNKHFYLFSIALLALSLLALAYTQQSILGMFFTIVLFFTAFNFLEASLPAFISMLAPAGTKGTAMGIYSSHQFFGAFFGGILGGLSYKLMGSSGLFLCLAGLMVIWFLLSLGMHNPSKIRTFTFSATIEDEQKVALLSDQLVALQGALEVVVIAAEQIVYIKANTQIFKQQEAQHILGVN
jgi:MFS family permease